VTRGLALLAALLVGLLLTNPVTQVANPGAATMLLGCLKLALAGCLLSLLLPSGASWLALGALGQAYVLVPLATPLLGPVSPYWGDPRFVLVGVLFGAAELLGVLAARRGGGAGGRLGATLFLSVPAGFRLVEAPGAGYLGAEMAAFLLLAFVLSRLPRKD